MEQPALKPSVKVITTALGRRQGSSYHIPTLLMRRLETQREEAFANVAPRVIMAEQGFEPRPV